MDRRGADGVSKWRWWIGGLLFASTVINYIDRQTVNVLGPYLKTEYHWNNQDFALVVVAFRAAYALGPTFAGRFLDRVGTRRGLSITVLWYSIASMLTSLATGLRSLCAFRFLLGLGESANWPGATKAVGEWFPAKERGLAVALFDSGSAVGATVAPFLVLWMYRHFGGWRPAFILTGCLGFLWLGVWRAFYRSPETARVESGSAERPSWGSILKLRQTWGIVLGKALTDPVWFFISDWFAIYLVSKGVKLEQGILAFWIPFIAADLGNFAGGGASSWLIARGWPVLSSRKAVILVTGIGMTLLIPTVFTSDVFALAGLFAVSTFCYAAWSTMDLVLPSDLYPSNAVATVSGISATGAGIGTIASTLTIGYVSDHYSFAPILIVASLIPLLATAFIFLLVRKAP
jgi:ACS family hexuronate transporter-like MFS transporter